LDNAEGIRSLASLLRRFDRQPVTLGKLGLDNAAKHCVLFTLNENKLSDLTTLERIAGYVAASWTWSERQVDLDRRWPNRAYGADIPLPIEW